MDKQTERVLQAQAGDCQAVEELLFEYGYRHEQPFCGYLGKYYRLLAEGMANTNDKDIRKFLNLYSGNSSQRKQRLYHFRDSSVVADMQSTIDYLHDHTQRIEKEDLRQELVLLFLECLQKFKIVNQRVNFKGYIYNTYRFRVYHYLNKNIFKINTLNIDVYCLEEDVHDYRQDITLNEAIFDALYEKEMTHDRLGIFWINGHCSDVFKALTIFERTIIRDWGWFKLTDGAIARQYGYHINTIFNTRKKAIQKLIVGLPYYYE